MDGSLLHSADGQDHGATPASTLDVLRGLVRAYTPSPDIGTIAVVGNAPLEASAERAAAIDDCDLVIRCNSFKLDEAGEPPGLGRRADVVVFNRLVRVSPWFFERYQERLYLMVEPGRLHNSRDNMPTRWPEDLGQVVVPNREITLTLSDALGVDSRGDRVWGTTGLMCVWIAATLFPNAELGLAGFSMIENPAQTEWAHAWGDSCSVGPEHRIDLEGQFLASWVSSGRAALLR